MAATWSDLGIELPDEHGRHRIRCPQCEGQRKTLGIDIDRGLYHCFRCGLSGRVGGSPNWLDGQLERIKQADEARSRERAKATRNARALWRNARSCDSHPYLARKAVPALGARCQGSLLVIPMYDAEGHLLNCQTIDPDGCKLFLRGGRVTGLYFPIAGTSDEIYLVEGFATGAALHAHIRPGARVAVAFNAGNLMPVAKAMRAKHPDTPLVIAADNDQWTPGNPGLTYAREAAAQVQADVLYPEFSHDEIQAKPTDFADMYQIQRARQHG